MIAPPTDLDARRAADPGSVPVERRLAAWAVDTTFEMLADDVVDIVKTLIFVIGGCVVTGGTGDGTEEVVELVRGWGGTPTATVLVHGGKVPAHNAVLANSTMARAYDICEFFPSGLHLGSSIVPVALAVAEQVGGVSGRDLITALAVGCEFGARMAKVSRLDGFDPSGVITVFAAAIVAGRLMRLDDEQMLHALALAFNRAGGSFQANIDGSLAVRLIQAFSSQNGIVCAELAARGMTGPRDFLTGRWGYYHLFADGVNGDERLTGGLGSTWDLRDVGFKKYPSCGGTLVATEAALNLVRDHDLPADEIAEVRVGLAGALQHGLVGHPFEPGPFPTVNGQFTASYCVANALQRGFPRLEHFLPSSVTAPDIVELVGKTTVIYDPELAGSGSESRARVSVRLNSGEEFSETVDSVNGGTARPLPHEVLVADFWERSAFGGIALPRKQLQAFLDAVAVLEQLDDAAERLVAVLVAPAANPS